MDETVNPKPKEKNKKILIAALIFVIALLLFMILFAINYFNVFAVGRVIPGFSRLPQFVPKVTPFLYNMPLGEATLAAFLQKNVNPAFSSTSPNAYFHAGPITQTNWIINKGDYSIAFDSKLFLGNLNNTVRYIIVTVFPTVSVNKGNLSSTLTSYFNVSLPTTLPCFDDKNTKSIYCQQLTRVGNTRRIVGAQFELDNSGSPSAQTTSLYFCELYKDVVDSPTVSCANVH